MMTIAQMISLGIGILAAGEGLLLLVGMTLLSPRPNPWNSMNHINTLLLDVVLGALLIFHAIEINPLIPVIVVALIATHAYREAEYLNKSKENKFLVNPPMFAINTVKLICLVVLLFAVL